MLPHRACQQAGIAQIFKGKLKNNLRNLCNLWQKETLWTETNYTRSSTVSISLSTAFL